MALEDSMDEAVQQTQATLQPADAPIIISEEEAVQKFAFLEGAVEG
jgi:hypothetical protein